MSGKNVCLCGLVLALLALGSAQGQEQPASPGGPGTSSAYRTLPGTTGPNDPAGGTTESGTDRRDADPTGGPGLSSPVPAGAHGPEGHFELSSWIKYPRSPVCCG